MAWWNIFTTSAKAVDTAANVVDGAVAGIDKLFFTEEEKSEMSLKAMEVWLKMQAAIGDENSVRSITRRIIAKAFTYTFLFLLIAGAALWKIDQAWSAHMLGIAKELAGPVMIIITFYFGYYAVSNIVGAAKKK